MKNVAMFYGVKNEDGVVKVLGVMDVKDEWGENKLGKILMEVRDELKKVG